jgi:alpha-galactosidase
MGLRVATALFGHMGVECDLRALSPQDIEDLAAGISLHRATRNLIHHGDMWRLESGAGGHAMMIVDAERAQALLSFTAARESQPVFPPRVRLAGLESAAIYAVELVWPPRLQAAFVAASGEALMQAGLQLPRLRPETAIILRLTRQ